MKRIVLAFLLAFIVAGAAVAKGPEINVDALGRLPVLHEGRVKPLSRFAAIEYRKISGGQRRDTTRWLALALFDPPGAAEQEIIKITHPGLLARLDLPPRKDGRYSLQELALALSQTQEQAAELAAKEPGALTAEQKALVDLHEKALVLSQILQAMTAFLPLDVPPSETGAPATYLDLQKNQQDVDRRVRALLDKKGDDLSRYTDEEKALAAIGFTFEMLQQAGAQNILLRVIPQGREWFSPWAALQGEEGGAKTLQAWQAMAQAYRAGDDGAFQRAAQEARVSNQALSSRLAAEEVYYKAAPLRVAAALYTLVFIFTALFLRRPRPVFYRIAAFSALAGTAAHGAAVALRVFILQRPPVGSLYESLLFVSLIVMLAALFIEVRRRDGFALIGAVAAALLIMLLSPLVAPRGDDLEMLVAVLNTNFWLATHVLCITSGYGLCILTAALAHIWLWRGGAQERMTGTVYVLSLTALLLTAVGTILGGIWADQSWGRFWGWDPKENGALLIALWLIWLQHGRVGGHLSIPQFMAGLAFLNVIVALAWFGVNLLSVGLHSYGFTSGLAGGLALFCGAEGAVIAALYLRRAKRKGNGII